MIVHEILDLEAGESSSITPRHSHSSRCHCVSRNPRARANARAYWAAIATLVVMQSTLGATLTLSLEGADRRHRPRCVSGALEANFLVESGRPSRLPSFSPDCCPSRFG